MNRRLLLLALTLSSAVLLGSVSLAEARVPKVDGDFTPLIVTPLEPDPSPVLGTDGKYHVAYELVVLNTSPRDLTITEVETLARGRVVQRVGAAEVAARSFLVADYATPPTPAATVPSGKSVILLLDGRYRNRKAVPRSFTHRFKASFGPLPPGLNLFARLFPERRVQTAGKVTTGTSKPIRIGRPVAGENWWAFNACCTLSSHRAAMVPIGGRINGAERYAVDWMQLDPEVSPLFDEAGQPVGLVRPGGDVGVNEDYISYGAPLFAVADGTVVSAVDGRPDAPAGVVTPTLTIPELPGNYVVLKIAPRRYAFYGHMEPGSISVKVGERVRRGEQIGRLGNSGSTTAPHLHFGVMAGAQPLTATQLPWVIDRFRLQGMATDSFEPGGDRPRRNQMPLIGTVTRFPAVNTGDGDRASRPR
jgi:murein DD-endopeptidase MepM/ murein hydrolase activator NlpD